MIAIKTVCWVGILSTLAVICHTCYSLSDVAENVSTDKFSEIDLEITLDFPVLEVTEEPENTHVEFVTKTSSTNVKSEERQNFESDLVENWIREILSDNKQHTNIEQPLNKKRVTRQNNSGYHLYPTLPTKSAYGNYGHYNQHNATNAYSHGLQPQFRLNTTNPTYYNNQNFTHSGTTNFSASVPNPYKYNNPQYPYYNGKNTSYPQYNNNPVNPGAYKYNNPQYPYYNGKNTSYAQYNNNPVNPGATYNSGYPYSRPTTNYSTNPYVVQPTTRPFHQGVTNNPTYPSYPSTRPYYPGSVYPGTPNNRTNPGYIPTTPRPPYIVNPGYLQSTNGSNRPINPQTNPSNTQSTTRPIYLGVSNNGFNPRYPGSFSYPGNRNNSTPPYSSRPYNNLPPNPSPYNSQNGNFPYNPNYNLNNSSRPYGTMPVSQRPNNNSGPYNSWNPQPQGYGQTSQYNNRQVNNTAYNPLGDLILQNPNAKTPMYRPDGNYPNNYTLSPNAQYPVNQPNGPYSQNNYHSGYPSDWNKPNPSPNHYNAEHKNFFYPPQNNGSSYDPRKNPPEHISYSH